MLTSHSKTCSYKVLSWFCQALTTRVQGPHVLGRPAKLSRVHDEALTMLLAVPIRSLSAVWLLKDPTTL
jgi:hypothetical protein